MKFCTLAIAGAFGPGCISRKSSSLGAWSTRTMLITGRVSGVVLTTAPLWAERGRMQTIVMAEKMSQPGSWLGGACRMQSPHFAPRLGTLDARLCGTSSTETKSFERPVVARPLYRVEARNLLALRG